MKKIYHKTSAFSLQPLAFSRGFTLIELLVVISIIAILAGMVMPMFYSAKERAREAKARIEVKALETAFKSYLDTYKVWPGPSVFPDGKIEDNIFKILRGEDIPSGANKDKIAFYEFGSTNSTETKAYDAWGANPGASLREDRVYRVMFDNDYDNQIAIPGGEIVYRCAVVWSPGNDGNNDSGGGDDVASWK